MEHYLSTYRKDFMWPYVRTLALRTEKKPYRSFREPRCICGAEPGGSMPPKEYVGPPEAHSYEWSRLGPTAPLLDPKLYPVKLGPAPEFEINRYDQPNTYLKKLQEKYPYLYNVLQSAPPDEMIRRVDEDRLRTTYQVDYGHIDERPPGDYEKLLGQARISGCTKDSSWRKSPPILDCRARLRPPDYDFDDSVPFLQPGERFDRRGIDDRQDLENDFGAYRNGYRDAANDFSDTGNDPRSDPRTGERARRNAGDREDEGRDRQIQDRQDYDRQGQDHRAEGRDQQGQDRQGYDRDRQGQDQQGHDRQGHDRGVNDAEGRRGEAYEREGHEGERARNARRDEPGPGRGQDGGGGGDPGALKKTGINYKGGEPKTRVTVKWSEEGDASKEPLPAWKSEYQEVIGQTGMDIIKDRLHQHGGRSSGRKLIERIIMKCRS